MIPTKLLLLFCVLEKLFLGLVIVSTIQPQLVNAQWSLENMFHWRARDHQTLNNNNNNFEDANVQNTKQSSDPETTTIATTSTSNEMAKKSFIDKFPLVKMLKSSNNENSRLYRFLNMFRRKKKKKPQMMPVMMAPVMPMPMPMPVQMAKPMALRPPPALLYGHKRMDKTKTGSALQSEDIFPEEEKN